MPESVSSADIEDVLSSIRRLVAGRSAEAGAAKSDDSEASTDDSDTTDDTTQEERLVLTEAFRISEEDGIAAESEEALLVDGAEGGDAVRHLHLGEQQTMDADEPVDIVPDDSAPVFFHARKLREDQSRAPDQDATETAPESTELDASATDDAEQAMDVGDMAVSAGSQTAAEDRSTHSQDDADPQATEETEKVDTPEEVMASEDDNEASGQDESDISDASDPVEPDEPEEISDMEASSADDEDASDLPPDETTDTTDTADPIGDDDALDADNLASLAATIANLEAVVGRRDEQWEPDGTDEVAETPKRVITLVPPAGTGTAANSDDPGTNVPDDLTDSDAAELFADETVLPIDEDALRDMVSIIVRQELQGALGERITRNVRKLVRREIQRALAAHELD